MVELLCGAVLVGMVVGGVAHHGVADAFDAVSVSIPAGLAGLMLAGLRSCSGTEDPMAYRANVCPSPSALPIPRLACGDMIFVCGDMFPPAQWAPAWDPSRPYPSQSIKSIRHFYNFNVRIESCRKLIHYRLF